jgi:hypothetical protein
MASATEFNTESTTEVKAPAVLDTASLLSSIATMKAELARLESALGGDSVVLPAKLAKGRAKKDPSAPKKPSTNPYILFAGRVHKLFTTVKVAAKEAGDEEREKRFSMPAPVNKQFASFLGAQRTKEVEKNGKQVTVADYDSWEDNDILEAFESWTPPEVSKMEAAGKTKKQKKAAADSASESGSVAGSADSETEAEKPKERKKRAPMTEEAKAAMAAKKAANKAAKEAASAKDSESEAEEEAPVPAPAPAPAAKESKFSLKKKEKAEEAPAVTYTLEELKDFAPFTYEGEDFGVNKRGDVVNNDGDYVGNYDAKKKKLNTKAVKPADWDEITASEEDEE